MKSDMIDFKYLNSPLPGDQEDLARRFEDCSASIQQIIHRIETVEAQLREKRQTIEGILARHETLAGELELAISDPGNILSTHEMLSEDAPISMSAKVLGSGNLEAVSEHPHHSQEVSDEYVDPASLRAGVRRVLKRKRRSDVKTACSESMAETVQGEGS